MTVREIMLKYLKDQGYDGLCDGAGCGCGLDFLASCDSDWWDCVPARKKIATAEDIDEENGSEFEVGDEIFFPAEGEKHEKKDSLA